MANRLKRHNEKTPGPLLRDEGFGSILVLRTGPATVPVTRGPGECQSPHRDGNKDHDILQASGAELERAENCERRDDENEKSFYDYHYIPFRRCGWKVCGRKLPRSYIIA